MAALAFDAPVFPVERQGQTSCHLVFAASFCWAATPCCQTCLHGIHLCGTCLTHRRHPSLHPPGDLLGIRCIRVNDEPLGIDCFLQPGYLLLRCASDVLPETRVTALVSCLTATDLSSLGHVFLRSLRSVPASCRPCPVRVQPRPGHDLRRLCRSCGARTRCSGHWHYGRPRRYIRPSPSYCWPLFPLGTHSFMKSTAIFRSVSVLKSPWPIILDDDARRPLLSRGLPRQCNRSHRRLSAAKVISPTVTEPLPESSALSLGRLSPRTLSGAPGRGKARPAFPYAASGSGIFPPCWPEEIVHGVGARLVIERCPFAQVIGASAEGAFDPVIPLLFRGRKLLAEIFPAGEPASRVGILREILPGPGIFGPGGCFLQAFF